MNERLRKDEYPMDIQENEPLADGFVAAHN